MRVEWYQTILTNFTCLYEASVISLAKRKGG